VRLALADLAAVARLGSDIAARLRIGDVVALSGGLGVGKTTLARAILAGLGHAGEVPSPSFSIIETYDPPEVRLGIVHADFYRLEHPEEVRALGLDDYREGRAMIAEWPENAGGFALEPGCLAVALEFAAESGAAGRFAIVEGGSDWLGRMPCQ
jgi:tRNA threonylcarbamoyladenosine biosynthesis protein TsaE